MAKRWLAGTLWLAVVMVGAGCSKGSEPPGEGGAPSVAPGSPAVPVTVEKAEADQIFQTRCSTCHGFDGAGDGPASAALNPRPRNFHLLAWQKSVTDTHIEKIITDGGPAVGKSPLMPPNPDLASKPAVVRALREKIRGFEGGGQ